jgi:MFS family permease
VASALSPIARVYRHRDFRLLWSGAFLSFIGSWIQTVGQGYLVYELTGSKADLAAVSFAASLPVMIIGPFAGAVVDTINRKRLLIACQIALACTALFLSAATHYKFVQYWHILAAALVVGFVGAFEMPTRQSVVSRVVPPEDLAAAIPLNALTFNMARLVGPALGGVLLATIGVSANYLANGLSYFAIVATVLAIRADLHTTGGDRGPIQDLVREGMLYTFRDRTLRTLFLLEAAVSAFAIFYIALMPAIAKSMLGLGRQGLGFCYTSIGVGSVCSLLLMSVMSGRSRALVLKADMTAMGLLLIALAGTHYPPIAFVLFALMGFCAVAHFNTTNTLFQLLSPDRLRGRVLSMHVWALAGLSPIGTIFFGWLADATSLETALHAGGTCTLAAAAYAWVYKEGLRGVE